MNSSIQFWYTIFINIKFTLTNCNSKLNIIHFNILINVIISLQKDKLVKCVYIIQIVGNFEYIILYYVDIKQNTVINFKTR
jgi:hypothetical protein